jgi:hypothetical protein
MKIARLVSAIHELADAIGETFDEEAANDSATPIKRPRAKRLMKRPPGESDELSRAKARQLLIACGFQSVKR